mmetsp:Transcript_118496/g.335138  ORF Transcript_118496/g.335138 Transcript_118496/m.335138 type:complete len:350 (+) Transcript_118496:282-1331(+)
MPRGALRDRPRAPGRFASAGATICNLCGARQLVPAEGLPHMNLCRRPACHAIPARTKVPQRHRLGPRPETDRLQAARFEVARGTSARCCPATAAAQRVGRLPFHRGGATRAKTAPRNIRILWHTRWPSRMDCMACATIGWHGFHNHRFRLVGRPLPSCMGAQTSGASGGACRWRRFAGRCVCTPEGHPAGWKTLRRLSRGYFSRTPSPPRRNQRCLGKVRLHGRACRSLALEPVPIPPPADPSPSTHMMPPAAWCHRRCRDRLGKRGHATPYRCRRHAPVARGLGPHSKACGRGADCQTACAGPWRASRRPQRLWPRRAHRLYLRRRARRLPCRWPSFCRTSSPYAASP